jgi:hypothetical protein
VTIATSSTPGLGDEEPVERIAMVTRQVARRPRVPRRDGQPGEALLRDQLRELVRGRELAQRALDRRLPDARRAHEDLVGGVGDGGARGVAEHVVVAQPPQHGVGVGEQPRHRV